jgi:hypothetical protein
MLAVEQLKNLSQRIQLRHGIKAACEAFTEIRTGHPVRQIDDRLIDFEFEISAKIILDTANHLAFSAKERV